MKKVVPYKKDFDHVSNVQKISDLILFCFVAVAIATILVPFIGLKRTTLDCISSSLNLVNGFLAVAFFLSDIVSNYLFQQAEAKRRDDFFDNSLNTNLAEEKSNKYFTNDNISVGIKKMGVNSFENAFFTKAIATKMLTPMITKSIAIVLLLVFLALFTSQNTLATILQLTLPFAVIQQTYRLFVFRNRIEAISKNFQQIFSSTNNKKTIEQAIILNVTSYETTLAWACIKIDSNIFNKMNGDLSEKWKNLKNTCNGIDKTDK